MTKYWLIGCIVGFLIGLLCKVPKLIGLGLPVLYTLIVMWIPGWSTAHPMLSGAIFYGLIAFNALLWLLALLQKIDDALTERRLERKEIARAIQQLKQQRIVECGTPIRK